MLSDIQLEQLLKPLNRTRVANRSVSGTTLSYLETWDVRAMMIRVFGFGGWSFDVVSADLAFEGEKEGKWNVGWKVAGRLWVPLLGCTYTEAAVGFATLGSRGEAHDMAIKTAESDAFKRACVNLGTQFGLSLYNDGATRDVVMQVLVNGDAVGPFHNGTPVSPVEATESDATVESAPPSPEVEGWMDRLREPMNAGDVAGVIAIKSEMTAAGVLEVLYDGKTLGKLADQAVVYAGTVTT